MKKLLLSIIAILTLSISTSTMAQPKDKKMDPVEMSKKQTERMKEDLKLTKEQEVKVSEINLMFATKIHDTRKAAGDDRNVMREKLKPIRDERLASLKKVLTKQQYETFIIKEEEMKNKREQGRSQK